MHIAAATVSMEAKRNDKEVEQRFSGLRTETAQATDPLPTDSFGLRLATVMASATRTELTCQSTVSGAAGECGQYLTQAATDNGTASLAQLTAQILGQPVRIGTVDTGAARLAEPAQPLAPTHRVGLQTATLVSGTAYRQDASLFFSAQGTVQTTDGREIGFDLGLSMSSSRMSASSTALDVSTLFVDPLMLQFDPGASLLGEQSFLFDLNSDGTAEQLACPGTGCGFLALDRNQDGRINNGRELFGPTTDSGFGELASLDSDGNLWIDETDPAFDQLLIWHPDGQGGQSLMSLRQAGVGAIAVTNAGTGFRLDRPDGSVLGMVKASGIFLTEAGEVRAMHEVDLRLPAASADENVRDEQAGQGSGGLETALQGLRQIIAMQQLRLQMLLTGQRLHLMAASDQQEQRQFLFEGLQARNSMGEPWWSQAGSEPQLPLASRTSVAEGTDPPKAAA